MKLKNICELSAITHHEIYEVKNLFQDAQLGIPQFPDHTMTPRFTKNTSYMQNNAVTDFEGYATSWQPSNCKLMQPDMPIEFIDKVPIYTIRDVSKSRET